MDQKTKSLQAEWLDYRDACYPDGLFKQQEDECRQAFFSGAMVVFALINEASRMGREHAKVFTRQLFTEVETALQQRATDLKAAPDSTKSK